MYEDIHIHIYTPTERGLLTLKPQEQKTEFIRLRAEGRSYSYIADTLHISKSTCSSWEKELQDAIAELKQEQLNELYNSYAMTKEARVKKLGETLNGINEALEAVDLSEIPAEKLLDFKLKYTEALKGEYTGSGKAYQLNKGNIEAKDIVQAYGDLLARVQAGEISTEQASRESAVLANLLKAYDLVEVKAKLDALEAIVGGRN